jgi:hypothetical protein
VQVADGLTGLVGLPELLGRPAPHPPTPSADPSADSLPPLPPSLPPLSSEPWRALAPYRVAQPVLVRVISKRVGLGGRGRLVGLSLHVPRLNPELASPAQLVSGAEYWGRVVLVDATKATVSLELPHTYELPRSEGGGPHLAVGQLIRVAVDRSTDVPQDGRPKLTARLMPPPDGGLMSSLPVNDDDDDGRYGHHVAASAASGSGGSLKRSVTGEPSKRTWEESVVEEEDEEESGEESDEDGDYTPHLGEEPAAGAGRHKRRRVEPAAADEEEQRFLTCGL